MSKYAASPSNLLSSDALSSVELGLSASESPDFERLGLTEVHFKLALGEIARSILVAGGRLTYGGHLDPDGYTAFLLQELHRYGRRDRPLRVCLAWPAHRRMALQDLLRIERDLGLLGKIECLDPKGAVIDAKASRTDAPVRADPAQTPESLTSLRKHIIQGIDGLVLIGGKREGSQGLMSGVLEEALLALDADLPLYLAGGFGGVTADIAKALKVDDRAWLPDRPDAKPMADDLREGLEKVAAFGQHSEWCGLNNGLSDSENRQLAATHRPSEIAALVSLGLGRRFNK